MAEVTVGDRATSARPATKGLWVALVVGVALAVLAGACGGDETKASPSPTTPDGKLAALPSDVCTLLRATDVERITGEDVKEARSTSGQCAYVGPDNRTLVASVYVERGGQAVINFDDFANTRDSKKHSVDGADQANFSAPFYTVAALKTASRTHVVAQVPALQDESEGRVKEAATEIAELLLTRV